MTTTQNDDLVSRLRERANYIAVFEENQHDGNLFRAAADALAKGREWLPLDTPKTAIQNGNDAGCWVVRERYTITAFRYEYEAIAYANRVGPQNAQCNEGPTTLVYMKPAPEPPSVAPQALRDDGSGCTEYKGTIFYRQHGKGWCVSREQHDAKVQELCDQVATQQAVTATLHPSAREACEGLVRHWEAVASSITCNGSKSWKRGVLMCARALEAALRGDQ